MMKVFKENHEERMDEVRNQTDQEFRKLAEVYNTGQISKKEWVFAKEKVKITAHEKRKEIIAKREFDIDREEEYLLNRIVGTDNKADMQRYRELYKGYSEKATDKDFMLREYQTSVKLDDPLAAKASAAVAAEHGLNEITADYGARDKDFSESIGEYRAFKTKWRDQFRKFSEYQSGKFGFIREPNSKTETFEAGFINDGSGRKLPYFRERVKYE